MLIEDENFISYLCKNGRQCRMFDIHISSTCIQSYSIAVVFPYIKVWTLQRGEADVPLFKTNAGTRPK